MLEWGPALRLRRLGHLMPKLAPAPGPASRPLVLSRVLPLRVLLVYRHYASSFVFYPWMLARGGIEVDVVATVGHPVLHSRFVQRAEAVKADDEAFRRAVSQRLAEGVYGMLLFMDEPSRAVFYRGAVDPIVEPYLPVPRRSELVKAFSDKEFFQGWCERNGVATPRTVSVATADEAIALAREWDYPVVLKGATGMGGKAVRVCHSHPDVRAAFGELSAGGNVLAQRFVHGAIGSTSFVALRGQVGAWTASEKFMSVAKGLGPSAVRRVRNDPELGRIAAKIAAAGEITGITGFDWMEGAPGEFLVIDPHFGRCTPPAAISHLAGVDLGRALRDLLEDTGRKQEPTANHGLVVAMFPQFIELLFQGEAWTLLRRANPFARNVRYFFGPWKEAAMSLRVAGSYISGGAKVFLGRFRRRRVVDLLPAPAAAAASSPTSVAVAAVPKVTAVKPRQVGLA